MIDSDGVSAPALPFSPSPDATAAIRTINWSDLNVYKFSAYSVLFIFSTDALLYPSDLITTRLQNDRGINGANYKIRRMFSSIYKSEGVRGLYRGFWPYCLASLPSQYVHFFSYEWFNELFSKVPVGCCDSSPSGLTRFSAGFVSEILSGAVYLPSEIVSQRLQVQAKLSFYSIKYQSTGAIDIIKDCIKTEGPAGLYRGFVPYLVVACPSAAIWWSSYEFCKEKLSLVHGIHSHGNHFFSGIFAGLVATVFSNPLDVARTRFQLLEAKHSNDKTLLRRGFFCLIKDINQKQGASAFFKGLAPRVFIRVPGSAVISFGYEILKTTSIQDKI